MLTGGADGRVARGRLMAAALAGAWRRPTPAWTLGGDDLRAVARPLLGTGGGALLWHRIRGSPLAALPAAAELQQAYRLQSLLAAVHEGQLLQVAAALEAGGIRFVLLKGWSVARLYPEAGLRPYGDHDVCVAREDLPAASAALRALRDEGCPVDVHGGLALLKDRPADEVWRRTRPLPVGGAQVRVLGAEDQLRHLCWHLLDHGPWRPLWLCDVAAALEARPPDFDWDYFLRGSRQRSRGVVYSLGLAGELLGARLEDTPVAAQAAAFPRWMLTAVLREWGKGYRHREPLAYHLRTRSGVLASLRASWPDPIKATVGVRAPFNRFPRLPFQLAQCAKRAAQIAAALARPAPR